MTPEKRFLKARNSFAVILVLTLTLSASAEWKEKVLYSFQGVPDGAVPVGAVVFDKHGNLYGVTQSGGSSSCHSIEQCGTVYRLAPPAKEGDPWTETVLYVFKGNSDDDGASPYGGLVIDSDGNLYGTTGYGGTGNCKVLGTLMGCGTVFELSPPQQEGGAWTEKVLYSFPNAKAGFNPFGDLVFDSVGNLYGATYFGGGKGTTCDPDYEYCGTILSPPKTKGREWIEKLLYSFKGFEPGAQFGDGANPNGGLVFDSAGALYGTTYFGGNNVKGECQGGAGGTGCGIVFKLVPPATKAGKWTEQVLHKFDGHDGANPASGLVFDKSGNLYGTTFFGPPNGFGVVFELRKPSGKVHSWAETVLSLFNDESNGGYPISGLVLDLRGSLYGTTSAGDEFRGGTVFRLKPPGHIGGRWTQNVLYGFTGSPDAAHPAARLVLDNAGSLFGNSEWGGAGQGCGYGGCGTVFEVSP